MATSHPCLPRATTSVLVAVALISGAILVLGDRFDSARSYALGQPVLAEGRIAACVAEENMRLIDLDRERCHPGELELASDHGHPRRRPHPPGPPGARRSPRAHPGLRGRPARPERASRRAPGPEDGRRRSGRARVAGASGPAGPPGPAGAAGPPGRAGADGVSGFQIVTAKLAVGGREATAGERVARRARSPWAAESCPIPILPRPGPRRIPWSWRCQGRSR